MRILFQIVDGFLGLFFLLLLIRALISWFPNIDRTNVLVKFVFDITEPVLVPIRALMPQTGMMDFSVFIASIIILVLQRILHILAF